MHCTDLICTVRLHLSRSAVNQLIVGSCEVMCFIMIDISIEGGNNNTAGGQAIREMLDLFLIVENGMQTQHIFSPGKWGGGYKSTFGLQMYERM